MDEGEYSELLSSQSFVVEYSLTCAVFAGRRGEVP
jgi:hypothetical protein